jgi:hypothetical protein
VLGRLVVIGVLFSCASARAQDVPAETSEPPASPFDESAEAVGPGEEEEEEEVAAAVEVPAPDLSTVPLDGPVFVLGAGIALVLGGTGIAIGGAASDRPTMATASYLDDMLGAGIAIAIIGALVATAGSVWLVVYGERRARRSQPPPPEVALSPFALRVAF